MVTLGSPLGIPNLAFDRLDPAPTAGVGVWPCPEGAAWTNVADSADVVALVRTCGRCSGSRSGVSRWTTARTRTARCRT